MARGYKVRINVKPDRRFDGKLRATIALSDEVVAMIDKPYVSVKRMQDRLALVPWDSKAEGRGTVAISNNVLQFGVQSDCEKMQDFCGEYNLVNSTANGVVFVKLDDRKPFTKEFEGAGSKHDTVAEPVIVTQPQNLVDMLREAVAAKEQELAKAEEELDAALAIVEDARRARDKVEMELQAYNHALDVAGRGQDNG